MDWILVEPCTFLPPEITNIVLESLEAEVVVTLGADFSLECVERSNTPDNGLDLGVFVVPLSGGSSVVFGRIFAPGFDFPSDASSEGFWRGVEDRCVLVPCEVVLVGRITFCFEEWTR